MNELTNAYRSQLLVLANNCNAQIDQIRKSNMLLRLKNASISNAIKNYNMAVASLKAKYNADIARLQLQQLQQPKKRQSLLVGINYNGTPYQLSGCISDVESLNAKYKEIYNAEIITDLTNKKPTKSTILAEFASLLDSAVSGDTVMFAFSGHGSYTTDLNNDEMDGLDEMIISCDLKCVLDDEFKSIINQKLKEGVILLALFDSCHSGSVLDLKYSYPNYSTKMINSADKNDTIGNVIMISGCMDHQTSAEAIISGKVAGAMTWSLLETLNQNPNGLSWCNLLTNMKNKLNSSGFIQIPQLSSGKPLDTSSNALF